MSRFLLVRRLPATTSASLMTRVPATTRPAPALYAPTAHGCHASSSSSNTPLLFRPRACAGDALLCVVQSRASPQLALIPSPSSSPPPPGPVPVPGPCPDHPLTSSPGPSTSPDPGSNPDPIPAPSSCRSSVPAGLQLRRTAAALGPLCRGCSHAYASHRAAAAAPPCRAEATAGLPCLGLASATLPSAVCAACPCARALFRRRAARR